MKAGADKGRRDTPRPADPLIEEVRLWRRKLWEQFGDDPERVYNHLRELEKAHAGRLVRADRDLPPSRSQ